MVATDCSVGLSPDVWNKASETTRTVLTPHGVASDDQGPAGVGVGYRLQGCRTVAVHKGGRTHHALMHFTYQHNILSVIFL